MWEFVQCLRSCFFHDAGPFSKLLLAFVPIDLLAFLYDGAIVLIFLFINGVTVIENAVGAGLFVLLG